ncbi:hypothetical protein NQ156_03345 [Microbacterium sp. zg.Y625]|uniref:hypothetical protein n=1 Tax=Microbacterium jiangjiandongii TaxID=3049071 RepID=UPI00214CBB44|nr:MULTISPECIES: hypothetical protein [unclassified Microbacterium]MCR2792092.1 hypothetical protein [Microbacterium sp. zg.Y625]MCR2814879.1 hypothetical protein [Microbacterium sp. zg.Y843]WIM24898.1 hypothetical protein QNO14_12255 [Microbacterium sp. zg-Y625]
MTERENEFDNTGGNQPDKGGVDEAALRETAADSPDAVDPAEQSSDGPDGVPAPVDGSAAPAPAPSHEAVGIGVTDDGGEHYGQDENRGTLTVSETQRADLSGEQEQRLPAMAQNNASEVDKVAGIVAQTRSDVATEPHERIVEVLHQRLEQSGIRLPDDEIAELARQVSTG